KALEEIGSEWDQNRRVVKLVKPGFGAYGAVPPKFPYFAVEFGLDGGGLARVLDDGRDIPAYFGREVIAELLDKDTRYWRKPKVERFEQLRTKVVQFENWWEPFNKWSVCDPGGVSASDTSELRNMPVPEGPELPPGLS
ncbi:CWF19 protein 2, partial [Fasciolopsis buskii]